MFSPWREATEPPASTSASISSASARTARTRSRTLPSARYMTSPGFSAPISSGRATDIRVASPTPSSPQANTTWSPGLRSTWSSAQRADAQLRAGQVLEDRDRPADAAGGVAHALRGLGVLLGGAVREVQPRDVHARRDHPLERLGIPRGGADRGDDLRVATPPAERTHRPSPTGARGRLAPSRLRTRDSTSTRSARPARVRRGRVGGVQDDVEQPGAPRHTRRRRP